MNRRASISRRLTPAALVSLMAAVVLGLFGCASTKQTRLQAEDDNGRDKYEVKTIGDVTTVANSEPISVAGVGIVVGLEGTGGEAPPGGQRAMLEDFLRKRGVKDVKGLLASKDASMVIVSARIPPGSRDHD